MKQQTKRKKKRNRPLCASKPAGNGAGRDGEQNEREAEESQVLTSLMKAFDSISLEEASSAYKEADGDISKAAEILADLTDNVDDPSTSSMSSGMSFSEFGSISGSSITGSSSGSSERFMEASMVSRKGYRGGNKQKRVVAASGTVSTMLGKDYVKACPRGVSANVKEFGNEFVTKEDAAQFLCSMLGDDCELSMAVVRDVLCECRHDVEKALYVLLDLSASSYKQSGNAGWLNDNVNYGEVTRFPIEHSDNPLERVSECTSLSSESKLDDSIWSYGLRDYSQVLTGPEAASPSSLSNELDLPQKLLEYLFNNLKSSEHEPSTMNWRHVVKKMQSLEHHIDVCPSSDALPQQDIYAKGDEYHEFRKSAKQHWDSMRSCYQKATAAYSKGQRDYATFLSDQGNIQTELAREADKKASQDIFKARNKGIENVITIDLHGQHIKQAMRLLKLHVLLGTYVPSIQKLRVITGCGRHGVGKSRLKQSVINFLESEGIEWSEENRGTLMIKLSGYKEYSFLDLDSDAE